MCKLKSAIILKDRVFIPDYDSHSEMLEELKIADTRENAERLFVRAELSPIDGDVFSDIDTWKFAVDQDIRPDWYVEEVDKARMVEAVKAWAKEHIHIGVDGLKIDSGRNHYIKDCNNGAIFDTSTVTAFGSSIVAAWGSSKVTAWDTSTVKAFDTSTVTAYGSSIVAAWGSSTVTAYASSTVIKRRYSSFDKANLILLDDATFKDNKSKIIYQSGDWELRLVGKDGKIDGSNEQ